MTDKTHGLFRIDEILRSKNMSMKELADLLTPDDAASERSVYSYLTQIVRNQKFPRPDKLTEIARVLNVDIRDLFISTKPTDIQNNDAGFPIYRKDESGQFVEIGFLKE